MLEVTEGEQVEDRNGDKTVDVLLDLKRPMFRLCPNQFHIVIALQQVYYPRITPSSLLHLKSSDCLSIISLPLSLP